MTPNVFEDHFWIVRTPEGFYARTLPAGAIRDADAVTRLDAPVQDATRLPADFAKIVAAAHPDWEAVPAAERVETYPLEPGHKGYSYTLATYTGEFLLWSKVPLDWPKVVEDAVRREQLDSADSDEPWEPTDILPILAILREKHGVELLRSGRYYHLGHRSETVRPPGY